MAFVVTLAIMLDEAVVEEYAVVVVISLACRRTFVMVVVTGSGLQVSHELV